uniref:MOK protein kinase n=1 Tax=Equus caballus TaxID=9796 RepID=A0A9L0SND0_HORSE
MGSTPTKWTCGVLAVCSTRSPVCSPSSLEPMSWTRSQKSMRSLARLLRRPSPSSNSKAMSFDFPFKKGSGIPLLTATVSPQCLSLLHAMVAYDPDERITAHQALQHPYFHEQRATEKQSLTSHRKAFLPERPVAPQLLSNNWQISKEGRKQKQSIKQEEDHPKRQGPACLMELPKLKFSGVTKLSSYSSPALQSAFGPGASGTVPVLRPLKCVGTNPKTDTQKDIKPNLRQCRLPTIGRKAGGY